MYQIRLANLNDKDRILNLVKESMKRQCYMEAPEGGLSDDYIQNNVVRDMEGANHTKGMYVLENESKEMLGACSFYFTFHRNGYTFIRFFVKNNLSLAMEAEILNGILQFAFMELNYNKINLELKSSQLKYSEVFVKSGFRKELCYKEHFYSNGRYEDILHLGLTKEDYVNKISGEELAILESYTTDEDYLLKANILPTKQLLFGEKVDLTAFTAEDEAEIYEACKGSDYMQYSTIAAPKPANVKYAKALTGSESDYMFFQKGILLAIRNKAGKVVGIIGSSDIDNRNRHLMISLEIYNNMERGKGYGSEAIRLFTDFAFLEMNMHRVYLGCFDFNSHAGYLYERLGFQPEGTNRSFVYRNGNYYNETAFGVVKKDWFKIRGYL